MVTNIFRLCRCVLVLLLLATIAACHKQTTVVPEEEETPVVETRADTTALPTQTIHRQYTCGNKTFAATICRQSERHAPLICDTSGDKYYDNSVSLTVYSGGATVLRRTFRRADFVPYIDTLYLPAARSTLTSIAFLSADATGATFVATVGSPDEMDDEHMFVSLHLSPSGQVSLAPMDAIE